MQYLQALAILIAGYYSVVIMLYYRIEISSIFRRLKNGKPKPERFLESEDVMGSAASDQDGDSLNSDDLEFPSLEPTEENH